MGAPFGFAPPYEEDADLLNGDYMSGVPNLVHQIVPTPGPMPLGGGATDAPLSMGGPQPKLVPALRMPDDSVAYGELGQNHADVAARVGHFPTSRDDLGFAVPPTATQPGGPLMSRDTAMGWLTQNEPSTVSNLQRSGPASDRPWGRLESNDLAQARQAADEPVAHNPTTDAQDFYNSVAASKASHPYGAAVELKPMDDYKNTNMFLSPDKQSGFAIKPDGDLVSAFSSVRGRLPSIMDTALNNGATKLDAFDTGLAQMYGKYGFKEVGREPWNDQYAPPDWPERLGKPDVVYMQHQPDAAPALPEAAPFSMAGALAEHGVNPRPDEMAKVKRWASMGMDPETIIGRLGEAGKKAPEGDYVPFNTPIGSGDYRISTRYPTGVEGVTENPLLEHLSIGLGETSQQPSFAQNMNVIPRYPGFGNLAGMPPEEIARQYIDQTAGNLQFLHSRLPDEVKQTSPLWYNGAQNFAGALADKWGIPRPSVSAAIAAMSPQKDWYMNGSLAERTGDIMFGAAAGRKMTSEMMDKAHDLGISADPGGKMMLQSIKGRSLDQIDDPAEQALWVRLYDETYNPRSFREITPTGELGPFVGTNSGDNFGIAWGSGNELSNAVRSLQSGGDPNKISQILPKTHKVRSFYNNIEVPDDPRFGDVTVDTHAVGAGQLRSVSGKDMAVAHNLGLSLKRNDQPPNWVPIGTSGYKSSGVKGTYGLLADAYRQAAAPLGLLPRALQSPTWEGIRLRFPRSEKGGIVGDRSPDNVWRSYERGEISLDQARNLIIPEGSIGTPSWAQPGFSSFDPRQGSTYR